MADNEANKQVVMQYVEAFNQGDLELLQGLFTPDAQIQGVLGWSELDRAIPIWKEIRMVSRMIS